MDLGTDFLGRLILLVAAGALTGFIAPFVLKRRDERKLREQREEDDRRLRNQKVFEADLTRQGKIIDSQAEFLDRFAGLLWEYQLRLVAVPYYQQFKSSPDRYKSALNSYHEKVGELLGKIRGEISKALRLIPSESHASYERLWNLYYDGLLELDKRLAALTHPDFGSHAESEWREFQDFVVFKFPAKVDEEIDRLAHELGLKANPSRGTVA